MSPLYTTEVNFNNQDVTEVHIFIHSSPVFRDSKSGKNKRSVFHGHHKSCVSSEMLCLLQLHSLLIFWASLLSVSQIR